MSVCGDESSGGSLLIAVFFGEFGGGFGKQVQAVFGGYLFDGVSELRR
jgi:hypothetical protein